MSQYDENRDGNKDGKRENRPTVGEADNSAVALAAMPEIAEVSTGAAGLRKHRGRAPSIPNATAGTIGKFLKLTCCPR